MNIEDFIARFSIFGLPAVIVVIALVQGAKAMGLPTKLIPLAALISGFLVGGALLLLEIAPETSPYILYIVASILMGLSAMGAYSGAKAIAGFMTVPPGSKVEEPAGDVYVVPK